MPATEQIWTLQVEEGETRDIVTALAEISALSRTAIKQAVAKGAVWLKRKGSEKRLRRTNVPLLSGDRLQLCYDPAILALAVPKLRCLADQRRYSLWFKPAGMVAQGTRFGDHCALLRAAEQQMNPTRECLLVHRLDRETSGLMLIAHDSKAAAAISGQLQRGALFKAYLALVTGHLQQPLTLEQPLDGQSATTLVTPVAYDGDAQLSLVAIRLVTGRTHQIRRHLSMAGFPLWGDPRYGRGNKNETGMALQAQALALTCPFSRRPYYWQAELPSWAETMVDEPQLSKVLEQMRRDHDSGNSNR